MMMNDLLLVMCHATCSDAREEVALELLFLPCYCKGLVCICGK